MSQIVTHGALLKCSCGTVPSPLTVLPTNRCLAGGMPVATIQDAAPMLNILPFGVCCLTPPFPGPCIPKTCLWLTGKIALLGNMPIIDKDAKLICMSGGIIEVIMPGQVNVIQG